MSRVAEYVEARELIVNLALRELRGKYKRSVLGWTWSLLNPLSNVIIFTVIFSVFLKIQPATGHPSGLRSFPLFLLCGLLPWNFLSAGMTTSMSALLANSNLIKKVYFPREILLLSATLALFVTFLIEMSVFIVVMLLFGNMVLPWIPVLLVLMLIEAVMVLGIGLILGVFNVYFRDIEHFVPISLQALFYSAPIVYPMRFVPKQKHVLGMTVPVRDIYVLNPLVKIVTVFRDVLYDLRFPAIGDVLYLSCWAVALLAIGLWVFRRFDRRLAEEL